MKLLLLPSSSHALSRTAFALGALAFAACASSPEGGAPPNADEAAAQALTLASITPVAAPVAAGAPTFQSLTEAPGGLSLVWQGPGGAVTGFKVYRLLKSEGFFRLYAGVPVDHGAAATYTWIDTQVTAGTEYCYAIGAAGAQSSIPISSTRCLVYTAGGSVNVPVAPTIVVQTAQSDRIRLLVTDNATNDASTVLERRPVVTATSNGVGTVAPWQTIGTLAAQAGTGLTSTIDDTGLDIDVAYQYRARAVNDAGEGISNTLSARTSAWTLPVVNHGIRPAITSIARPLSALGSGLTVTWNANSTTATRWTVYVSQGLSGDPTPTSLHFQGDLLATRSFTADSLTPGLPYCFRIQNNDDNIYSNTLCDVPYAPRHTADDHGPLAMTSMAAHTVPETSNAVATLTFDDPNAAPVANLFEYWKDADGIRDTRAFQGNAQPGTGHAFDHVHLDPGTRYCFRVLSANTFGSKSSAVACTTTTALLPSAPGALTAEKSTGSYNFTLKLGTAFTNVGWFVIKFHGTRGSETDDGESDPSFPDFLAEGKSLKINLQDTYRYCFTVQTANYVGVSAPSNTACAGTEAPPAPTPHTATIQMAQHPIDVAGYVPYAGTFGPIFAGATITTINFPTQFPAVLLVKPGHSTQDCGDPDAVVLVHGDMTSAQLEAVFGSSILHISGQQALAFAGCTTASVANPPPWLPVNVSWTEP